MCRSRRELSNEYLLAKIGVDTAENELLEVLFNIIQYCSFVSLVVPQPLELRVLLEIQDRPEDGPAVPLQNDTAERPDGQPDHSA